MAFIKKSIKVQQEPSSTCAQNIKFPADVIALAKSNNIATSPLDLVSLTSLIGIKMSFAPMQPEESGLLKKNKRDGTWEMTINSLHHPHRQRFTIAHELAHHIKHGAMQDEFVDQSFFRNGNSNPMEAEANKFAAEILMPKDDFSNYVENHSKSIEQIANFFQVSSMAVRIRAKQLGYTGHNL